MSGIMTCAILSPGKGGRGTGGFTLLELLVVVAIICVLSVIAVPAFSSLYADYCLKAAVWELKDLFKDAKLLSIQDKECAIVFDPPTGGRLCIPVKELMASGKPGMNSLSGNLASPAKEAVSASAMETGGLSQSVLKQMTALHSRTTGSPAMRDLSVRPAVSISSPPRPAAPWRWSSMRRISPAPCTGGTEHAG